jgi:uncharacterized protein
MRCTALKTADGRWVAQRVLMAHSFGERLIGLLRLKALDLDEGLMLSPGASIHTFGMHYPIDAVFLNGQMKILKVSLHVPPWRIRLAPPETKHVLEVAAGRARALSLQSGTFLCISEEPHDRCDASRDRTSRTQCGASIQFTLRVPRVNPSHHARHDRPAECGTKAAKEADLMHR